MKLKHKIAIGAGLGVSVLALSLQSHRVAPAYYYPPADITGVTNPSVTQNTIDQTICVSGWTATIRPPSNYTTNLKHQQEVQYGLATSTGEEEDHYISLELGGNPTDPKNLWPESYPIAKLKDQTETYLKTQICNGSITLAEAQKEITGDWYKVYLSIHPTYGSISNVEADTDDE